MMAMGARIVGVELALGCVEAFLAGEFQGGRHAARVDKIGAMENRGLDRRPALARSADPRLPHEAGTLRMARPRTRQPRHSGVVLAPRPRAVSPVPALDALTRHGPILAALAASLAAVALIAIADSVPSRASTVAGSPSAAVSMPCVIASPTLPAMPTSPAISGVPAPSSSVTPQPTPTPTESPSATPSQSPNPSRRRRRARCRARRPPPSPDPCAVPSPSPLDAHATHATAGGDSAHPTRSPRPAAVRPGRVLVARNVPFMRRQACYEHADRLRQRG